MTKLVQIYMTQKDEKQFSDLLKLKFPELTFLDDKVWALPLPLEKLSIDQCKANYAYIWNKAIYQQLPIRQRENGQFEGPGNGPVIQFGRSRLEDGILYSGSVTAGFNNDNPKFSELDVFTKELWKILRKHGNSKLICVNRETGEVLNPNVTGYLAWPDAINWVQEKKEHFFKDRGTWNFCLPNPDFLKAQS